LSVIALEVGCGTVIHCVANRTIKGLTRATESSR
jgi:hypothetical protein